MLSNVILLAQIFEQTTSSLYIPLRVFKSVLIDEIIAFRFTQWGPKILCLAG